MRLNEALDVAVAEAKQMKEYVCRKRPADIKAMVDVWRGDELVAAVVPDRHERDLILAVFAACAVGFDADTLVLTHEGYTATIRLPADLDHPTEEDLEEMERSKSNPLTGRPWAAGEMHDVAVHHGGVAKGWIHEVLSIACANRAGDIGMVTLPYRYVAGHVVWGQRLDMPERMTPGGIIPEAMVTAMNAPSMGTVLPYLPEEGPRAERDLLVIEAMMQQLPCRAALYSANEDRSRVLRRFGMMR